MFAPTNDTISEVTNWLVSSGISESSIVHTDNKGWLALNIPARDAERLFDTAFHEHEHSRDGSIRIGCDQ